MKHEVRFQGVSYRKYEILDVRASTLTRRHEERANAGCCRGKMPDYCFTTGPQLCNWLQHTVLNAYSAATKPP